MNKIKLKIENLDQKILPGWSVIAATGFKMPLKKPVTINALLTQEWGITSKYLDERIQTLLLNSSPVDNTETIEVKPGDTITLSGAMPGLAGAILRRDGILAGMRHSISAQNVDTLETISRWVTVKLFNLIINDLRSLFLEQGIVLPVDQGLDFLEKMTAAIPPTSRRLWLNTQLIEFAKLKTLREAAGFIEIVISH